MCPALLDRRVVRGRLDLVQRLTLPVGNLSQAPGQPAKPDLSKLVKRREAGVQFGRGGGNGPRCREAPPIVEGQRRQARGPVQGPATHTTK